MINGIMKPMKTIIKKVDKNQIDEDVIQEAGEILKRGGLVAFPTETVYGLGANALDEEAAKKNLCSKRASVRQSADRAYCRCAGT